MYSLSTKSCQTRKPGRSTSLMWEVEGKGGKKRTFVGLENCNLVELVWRK
jgi:hypothetical protein